MSTSEVSPAPGTQFDESVPTSRYFLPEQGAAAHARLMAMMAPTADPFCILAFTINDPDLLDRIDAIDAAAETAGAGIVGLIAADHTQETTPGEHAALVARASKWKHVILVILTAGDGPKPSQIWHYKIVARQAADGEPLIYDGSCNLSPVTTGWAEGNLCNFYRSARMYEAVRQEFDRHLALALANEPQYQIMNLDALKADEAILEGGAS